MAPSGVFQGGDRAVGAGRGVVDRGDVDRQGVGALVGVYAAVGRAPVVLHLEGEGGVGAAFPFTTLFRSQLVGGDVGDRDELAGGDGHAVVLEAPGAGQGGDLHGGQGVGRGAVG